MTSLLLSLALLFQLAILAPASGTGDLPPGSGSGNQTEGDGTPPPPPK
jgi:hypothetical protein